VLIQRNANHAFDCTDEVHPDTAEAAALAARVVGLDIAGIDLVCDDIGKPLSAQGGAIVEVNAGPGLLMHIKPGEGKTRPVGEAIVANLFAPHESGRIPLVGVSGTEGRTPVARLVAHMLYLAGRHAGLACADGLFLGRRQVHDGGAVNWADGRRLLLNRAVEAAVIESSAELILGEGLAYDRCSVGVVTNILPQAEDLSRWDVQPDGSEYYTTPRAIYRSQVDVVLPSGHAVLNAEDERVAGLAGLCDGKVIFFALDRRNATLEAHLESGGHGVFLAGGCIALSTGRRESSLCLVDDVPLIGRPGRPGDIAAVLAAVAAGWALGLTQEVIGTAVKTYGLELPEPAVAHV